MASRIVHLTIAKKISESVQIHDIDRFVIGQLLPDAIVRDNPSHASTHFKRITPDGKMKFLDFHEFFDKYRQSVLNDNLYLGYYLHLIQDSVYREFIYNTHNFIRYHGEQFRNDLHKDYSLLNRYLIDKNGLKAVDFRFAEIVTDELYEHYPFITADFLKDMESDFSTEAEGTAKYLTENMVDDYIELAASICINEVEQVFVGNTFAEPLDYCWTRR